MAWANGEKLPYGTRPHRGWKSAQAAAWVCGVGMLVSLLVVPTVGLHALWNVLIPAAPLLFAMAPGVWRNVCPLGTSALLARHTGISRKRIAGRRTRESLAVSGLAGLLVLVPLRHVILNTSGIASAGALLALGVCAVAVGWRWEWKSGWCSGMCPVHAVEKLYGSEPLVTVENAHCTACAGCVAVCPDSTRNMRPAHARRGVERWVGMIVTGGFAGFVWGWFQVRDYTDGEGWGHLVSAYGWPLGGMVASLALYSALLGVVGTRHRARLGRSFAAAALATYYWYRLPALVGYGPFPGEGMLVDLTGSITPVAVGISRILTSGLAIWLLVVRFERRRSWSRRPATARALSEYSVSP